MCTILFVSPELFLGDSCDSDGYLDEAEHGGDPPALQLAQGVRPTTQRRQLLELTKENWISVPTKSAEFPYYDTYSVLLQ